MLKQLKRLIGMSLFDYSKRDSVITSALFFLLIESIIFTSSAGMSTSTTVTSTFAGLIKQIIFIIIGILAYNYFSNSFDIDKCRNNIGLIIVGEIILLLAAWVYCVINGSINGNYAWLYIGPFSLQPSEFAKVTIVLMVACLIADRRFKGAKNGFEAIKKPFWFYLIFVGIIVGFQKDLGSGVICLAIGALLCYIPQNKKLVGVKIIISGLIVLGLILYVLLHLEPVYTALFNAPIIGTMAHRFNALVNPSYFDDSTREIFYSFLGISKGSLLGVGLGNSVQKFGYLVSSDADYIFAVIVEETGLIGIFAIFIPYFVIFVYLIDYFRKVRTESDKVIVLGALLYLFLHFFLNIGGVSGMLPLTGVPLLLISRGGSATLSIMIMMGIAQNVISKYNKEEEKRREADNRDYII